MRSDPTLHTMSMNTSRDQSLWSVLRENAALIGMYLLGTILFAFVRWPLGVIYAGYCTFSVVLYMAMMCPYCPHHSARTCPAGYHHISAQFFQPKEGRHFADQFRRVTVAMVPGWGLPPVVGLYLFITDFSWVVVVVVLLFCLVGFWILPKGSRQQCERCENAENCPWGKGKSTAN